MFEKIKLFFGGRDSQGYDRHGFDKTGRDRDGYDRRGFSRKGIHKITGTVYDEEGYNVKGFDSDGEHREYAHLKGNRISFLEQGILCIDLHGMNVKAAVLLLEEVLSSYYDIHRIILIHGHVHGSSLRNVISTFDHPRITKIITGLYNEGMRVFDIKEKENDE